MRQNTQEMEGAKDDSWKYSHYNYRPKDWREIDQDEFSSEFFHYIFNPVESRSIWYNEGADSIHVMEGLFRARLFTLSYDTLEPLGVAIVDDWKAKKIKFYKYGSPEAWKAFSGRFAAQFAGDNS